MYCAEDDHKALKSPLTGVGLHSYPTSDQKSFLSTYSETSQFSELHDEGELSDEIVKVPTQKKFGFLDYIKGMPFMVFHSTKKVLSLSL